MYKTLNHNIGFGKKYFLKFHERFLDIFRKKTITSSPEEYEHAKNFIGIKEDKIDFIAYCISKYKKIDKKALRQSFGIREDQVLSLIHI